MQPYQNANGVEQWIKWAQFFCEPACHKDSRYSTVEVQQSDVDASPENYYLTAYLNTDSTLAPQILTRCIACPPYAAAYEWNDATDAPFDPRVNIFATQCYPWFGAIPPITYNTDTGNDLDISYEVMPTYVKLPPYVVTVRSVPCPANTYNRVCAHAKRHYYNTNQLAKYQCTPCPPGFHTAGLIGQWYCRPPAGNLFTFQPLAQITNLWGNRDLLNAAQGFRELECGYSPSHCLQPGCQEKQLLPEEFNELYVFSKLLVYRACLSGSYCPDAFTELSCPPERPWSPANSSTLQNCSCSAGKYLSASGVCQPCTAACTQPSGYYLPSSICLLKNGATADAPCLPCTNLPSPASAAATGNGFELLGVGGICPFACSYGATLSLQGQPSSSQPTVCGAQYTCTPMASLPQNSEGQYLFYATGGALPADAFRVDGATCTKTQLLSSALLNLAAPLWLPQLPSCYGQCGTPSQLCYAPAVAKSFGGQPWYAPDRQLQCQSCPPPSLLPSNAAVQYYVALAQASACRAPFIQCTAAETYFNTTAWECQSCLVRESAVCPPGTRLRGQGCRNLNKQFNLTSPAVDCLTCTLNMPDPSIHNRTFLNYNSLNGTQGDGGCAIESCAPLQTGFYWSEPCAGDVQGKQSPCSLDKQCPFAWQYMAAPCTLEADRLCTNCTTSNPGFSLLVSCSAAADSQWVPCAPGFYCPGSGQQLACPALHTSQPKAKRLSDCYCQVL